ncbi:F0F1 ATP synthase subunit B family protein [Xanthobacter sediminis]
MHEMELAELWVAIAFLVFVGILIYAGAHRAMTSALDRRGARISAELEEARRLKEEAQKLVAEFKRKQREAEAEAESIVTAAKAEAERLAAEAKTKLEDFVTRRTKMAEDKITQAEKQAIADVRAIAADTASRAAEGLLRVAATGQVAEKLISNGLSEIKSKLN